MALALLQEQRYDVTGVFLKVWSPDFLPCTWRDERRSAMRVCATLGVPFMTLDCEKEYKELVVDYMLNEYKAGRTPNPDVFCNKYVKFGVFLEKALELGADYVATGHYAQVSSSSFRPTSRNPETLLLESVDKEKDQSYFLHQLGPEQLVHTMFPIGHLHKSEVRKLAKKFNLPTADKKDSQGLCFIGKVDMKEFLAHYIKPEEGLPRQSGATAGDVLDEKGEVIGRHDGAVFYTIGERHGFEIFKKSESDTPLFVVAKDIEKNTITVVSKAEYTTIQKSFVVRDMNWCSGKVPDLDKKYDIRFRYRQEKQKCQIKFENGKYEIIPDEAQFGVANGQSAVVYDGEVCLGGGVIE